jgi:hypothetical protein
LPVLAVVPVIDRLSAKGGKALAGPRGAGSDLSMRAAS